MAKTQALKDLVNLPPSVIRTAVPIVVNGLAMLGLDQAIENDALWTISSAIVAIVYYLTARVLETYVSPNFGSLLLSRSQPEYNSAKQDATLIPPTLPPTAPPAAPPKIDLTPPDDVVESVPTKEETVATQPEPEAVHEFVGEIPDGFGFLLQEDRSDDEYNEAIGADDREWMAEEAAKLQLPKDLFNRPPT